MKLYTYVIAHDYGLAPNPFWGTLSLNVCKPKIRAAAETQDWEQAHSHVQLHKCIIS